jgi:two-component system, NarL family, nitrate/nitrite response regulator NarL
MIKILVVDDHPLVADGIGAMIRDAFDLEIIGICKTGNETLLFLETNQPDIILLDISLPDIDGLQLCEAIRNRNKEAKIIGLTSTNEAGIITGLLQRGGNGYLLKNMERSDLIDSITTVLSGKVYLSRAANEKVLEQFHRLGSTNSVPVLTRREKEVLQLLSDGLNGPQIAEKLFLSPLTVETHRKNMFKKFHATSLQMLLRIARDYRIL